MADTTVTSNIKINADTKQAQAQLTGLQKATERLRTGAVPGLGAAFGSLSSQAITLTGGLGGLSGVLSLVGQGALFLSPILGTLALVGSAAAVMFIQKKKAIEGATEALSANAQQLATVLSKNEDMKALLADAVARERTHLEAIQVKSQKAIAATERQIASLRQSTKAEVTHQMALDATGRMTTRLADAVGPLVTVTKEVTVLNENYEKELARLTAEQQQAVKAYSDATAGLEALDKADKEAAAAAKKHADQIAQQITRLNERNDIILMDERVALENRTQQAIMRTMAAEAQLAALRTKTTFENTDQIREAFAAQRNAEMAVFDERLTNADYFAGEQVAIEAERAVKLEALRQSEAAAIAAFEKKKADDTARSAKLQMNWYAIAGVAFQKMVSGQLKGQRAFAAFFIEMTGEAVSAALKAYAALWAAEAAANAITNPAVAASKAKAAAMAGAAAGVVSAAASAAAANILATGTQDQTTDITGGGETAAMGGRTRQLVARGPVNLTFYAPFTVQGHVMGIDDVHAMWLDWNEELLIQAGIDASKEY